MFSFSRSTSHLSSLHLPQTPSNISLSIPDFCSRSPCVLPSLPPELFPCHFSWSFIAAWSLLTLTPTQTLQCEYLNLRFAQHMFFIREVIHKRFLQVFSLSFLLGPGMCK